MRYENELKGKGKQVKGSAKEKLGKLSGNRDLQERVTRNESRAECKSGSAGPKEKSAQQLKNLAMKSPADI